MQITAQEFSDRLRDVYGLVSGDLAQTALAKPAAALYAEVRRRVFTEGKDSDGNALGQYSVKPLYVSREMFAKPGSFYAQGKSVALGYTQGDKLVPTFQLRRGVIKPTKRVIKNFSVVKSNNKPRKTMYLPQGYKELRDIQGLRTDIVDLTYRGDLKKDWAIAKDAQAFLLGFKTKQQSDKRFAVERQYGPVFYPTEQEKNKYLQAASFNLNRLTAGTLQGQIITPTIE